MRLPYRSLLALCSLVCAIQAHAFDAATFASTVTDPVRARNILYMVYYPENFSGVSPLILVSHGGIGSAIGFLEAPHLGTEYAEMGYIAIHVNHAASANILIHRTDRPADVSFIIDQLEAATLPLPFAFLGSIDLTRIGHIGHSFGGHTAYLLRAETSPMATWVTPGWMPWWHYHRRVPDTLGGFDNGPSDNTWVDIALPVYDIVGELETATSSATSRSPTGGSRHFFALRGRETNFSRSCLAKIIWISETMGAPKSKPSLQPNPAPSLTSTFAAIRRKCVRSVPSA